MRRASAPPAFGLYLMQAGKLQGRAQKDRIEDLFPGMPGIEPPLRQVPDPLGEVIHLVEVSLELVSAQR
jgi:hypothetical protein